MMKTKTDVHSANAKKEKIFQSRVQAQRTMISVMTACQLLLWVVFFGYDQSMQAVWQSALLLIVPGLLIHALWKGGAAALSSKAGRYVPLVLIPCLMADAVFVLFAISGYIDQLMPHYPHWAGVLAPCAFAFLACVCARERGVENGAFVLKGLLVILFVFSTVFLRSSNRSDRLWPLLAKGMLTQVKTALAGAGCLWGAALLFLLDEKRSQKTAKFVFLPWIVGCIWALWHGFVRPWSAGDEIAVAEKLMGLARHAYSITLYEIAGLMWMVGLPLCLCASTSVCASLIGRAFPKCPKWTVKGVFLCFVLSAVLFFPEKVLSVLRFALPLRALIAAAGGTAMVFIARKEAKK